MIKSIEELKNILDYPSNPQECLSAFKEISSPTWLDNLRNITKHANQKSYSIWDNVSKVGQQFSGKLRRLETKRPEHIDTSLESLKTYQHQFQDWKEENQIIHDLREQFGGFYEILNMVFVEKLFSTFPHIPLPYRAHLLEFIRNRSGSTYTGVWEAYAELSLIFPHSDKLESQIIHQRRVNIN